MPIKFLKDKKQFVITTKNTSYAFGILKDRYLNHIYYGKKKSGFELRSDKVVAFSPYIPEHTEKCSSNDFAQEISFFGSGDFRASALRLCGADGTGVTDFVYSGYKIFKGREALDGLPCARADEDTKTLKIIVTIDN